MKKIHFSLASCFFLALTLTAQTDDKGLKDYYKNFFPIGVAVSPQLFDNEQSAALITKHFSSMTPENVMKMGPIHPEKNRYNWAPADKIVDFAQKNGLLLRGHTLCWHNQTPSWFFKKGDSTVSKDELLARLKQHITDVVSRYKGKIYAWDVVNEAVPDGSDKIYRETEFYKIIGEEYIEKAFEYAHAADPQAKLFYNDYNTENASKRERIFQLVKKLKEKGVPIHGVGLQGHWSIFEPTAAELEASITKFSSLGLELHFTEVDVSVYHKQQERTKEPFKGKAEFTAEMDEKQAQQYKILFEIFRKHKDKITSVTFWNLSDKRSWLDNFPVPNRKDYPLLFDTAFKPKKAYWEVVRFSNAPSTKGLTGVRDTSYSNYSALKSTLKTHPNAVLIPETTHRSITERRNIPYSNTGTRDLQLDAFYPQKPSEKPRPAILIIHGGGWRTGNRTQHIPLAQRLAALGYVTFTAEYRLSTEALYPAAVHDLKAAIRWIRANAKEYGVDTNKIASLGFSAGGQLSALLGNTNGMKKFEGTQGNPHHSSQLQAIIDIDGILAYIHPESGEGDDSRSTSAATHWFGFSKNENPELWHEASALTYTGKNTPPTLFINSSVDRMHAGREDYRKKLAEFKIYCEVQSFDNSPHSFCLFSPWFDPTVAYIHTFLKRYFN